jgi:glycosyltransferase involved in cell wall biosynthesis
VAVARRLCPDVVVVHQTGRGKGDALLAGFRASTGDIIVTMDADGSTDGQEIVRFVAVLAAGADFVKGSRFASGGGSADLTSIRRCGNRILSGLVNRLFGTRYTDLCYGFNAFWSRHLATLALECEGFEVEALMNIRAAEAGLRVHEVPSFEHRRLHGMSNLRVVIDGWRIAVVILRLWRVHWQTQGLSYGSLRARRMASPQRAGLLSHVDAMPVQASSLSGTGAVTHDACLSRGDPHYGSVAL